MDEQKERWLGWLALSTATIAVLAAITTLYMGKFSTRAVLLQGVESNQWAYYQAKSIKQHTFEIQKERLELELATQEKLSPAARERYGKAIATYGSEVKRYDAEKKEIKTKAEGLALQKEKAQFMGGNFGYSLIFLQIAIMLSSIASLTKRHYLWYLGISACAGWLLFFLNATLHLF
ncbi:DUF4337 domain-containing protein [Geobacter pickeringii]|uniref:DUF4337 domain-containing protein n=1 Tax=Geobacter pickeringii TaxID=345632 RepID=A0A0B5B6C6_9BACT|nr:DUF4337 domain-containing protein [Geobacter pickeringii]AJE02092.1 hypothetical protein GPICK_00705 [Geobacter pickeringii]